jgi:hypothetical protein
MINSANHDSVSRLVADRPMCLATALDKAFENIDCMSAILRCQAKNRFYESTQRFIQPRPILWPQGVNFAVRKEIVQTFLSAQSVMPILAETKSERTIEDIADLARKSVFPLECLK